MDNELLPVLESIEGVASVTATGVLDTNLQVTMDQEKIDALNDRIQEQIDAQFVDAQKELDKASEQIESGKKKLAEGQSQMEEQLGAASNEITNHKIQLFQTEADLTGKLSELKTSQTSMDGVITTLQQTYEGASQLQSGIDGLQQLKDTVDQAKAGASQLYSAKLYVMAVWGICEATGKTVDEALEYAVNSAVKDRIRDVRSRSGIVLQI